MGRPRLEQDLQKSRSIRLSDKLWKALQNAAKRQKITVNQYLRTILKEKFENDVK